MFLAFCYTKQKYFSPHQHMSTEVTTKIEQQNVLIQLLIFSVAHEEYALNLTETQEIVEVPDITPVPNMPAAIKGVANLRGRIVTIIDLEALFGIQKSDVPKEHIIVAEKDDELFGLLVDSAEEVLRTTPDALRHTPELIQAHPHAAYLRGVVVTHKKQTEQTEISTKENPQERIILALNLEAILQEFNAIQSELLPQSPAASAVASDTPSISA